MSIGDGFADLLIGGGDNNGQYSYVVFGKAEGFEPLSVSTLNGTNGFRINDINADDNSGYSVSGAGDVNGDGFDDLLIGTKVNQYTVGQSYLVFSKAGNFDANLNLSTLNGTNGFKINGIDTGNNSGTLVSSAGDVNGDGFDDLIVGAPGADESYVIFGCDFTDFVTRAGTAGNDTLTGTAANQCLSRRLEQ